MRPAAGVKTVVIGVTERSLPSVDRGIANRPGDGNGLIAAVSFFSRQVFGPSRWQAGRSAGKTQ
jgi:hypothetical protein